VILDNTSRSRLSSLIPSVGIWAAALLIVMSVAGFWFLLPHRSLWAFWIVAVPLTLIAVVGILRRHFRFRAARRLRAFLDAYADREICRDHWK